MLTNNVWSYLNFNNNRIGIGVNFECDKLPDLTIFDTYLSLTVVNEVVKVNTNVGKNKSPPNRKKNDKEIVESNSVLMEQEIEED